MHQKKLPDAWNELKWWLFGSLEHERIQATGSLHTLQKRRHKLKFPDKLCRGMYLQFLARIWYHLPTQSSKLKMNFVQKSNCPQMSIY